MTNKAPNQINSLAAGIAGGILSSVLLLGGFLLISADSGDPTSFISPENDIERVVEETNDAVVSIIVTRDLESIRECFGFHNSSGWFFPCEENGETRTIEIGGGTGFVISEDGYIVTNAHVVDEDGADYTVLMNDQSEYEAEIISADSNLDIALIKIDGENLTSLEWGNSDDLALGETVVAIGNALGEFQNTVSSGIISGLDRTIAVSDSSGVQKLEDLIQTDAAINSGNSGGPLLNLDGEVIGMNTAVATQSENIGFAIPSSVVQDAIDEILEYGSVQYAYLGVRYVMVENADESFIANNPFAPDYGALIIPGEDSIVEHSPAADAGLKAGDIILEVDGVRVEGTNTLGALIQSRDVDDEVLLTVQRRGETLEFTVILSAAP